MDDDLRRACAAALIGLARSDDYRDRADAGRALASFAELPEASGPLLKLVLDADDTFVTLTTAEALLRRKDTAGLAIVASALAVTASDHEDWIHTAAVDVFGVLAADRDSAAALCEDLIRSTDGAPSRGAGRLLDILNAIDPVLRPA